MVREFMQVDVFSPDPFAGNPVAVVLDAEGLDHQAMQRIANWTNLSETTFVLPPTTSGADYRVRIFTPTRELPFAGHPTLGTCHAWLSGPGSGHRREPIVQECAVGLVTLHRAHGRLAFEAPPMFRTGPVDDHIRHRLAQVIGIDAEEIVEAAWVDNGPGWVAVLLADARQVLEVDPDLSRAPGPEPLELGVVGLYPTGSPCAIEVRAFFPDAGHGMVEDPVTGSLNASVAQWLLAAGRLSAPYVASQGGRLGRAGRVHITQDPDGAVFVGGDTATRIHGQLWAG